MARIFTRMRVGFKVQLGGSNSWRKCHKKTKNDPARFDSNLPSCGNAYKQNLELSIGDFSPIWSELHRCGAERQNSMREFGLGNLSGKVEMDMFGGLTKTSSRIAIAAALGLTLGGYAMSTPAKAADLGGDCCADLEERVAELEATTVRKGNKKVSVTLSGWVVKTMNWWDDGGGGNFAVGDKDADLASRFAITGSATIAPGWSAGYNLTVTAPDDTFGILSNQTDDIQGVNADINTLYSYIYIKSDSYGTLNWGTLSPASDNAAVLADISGTVIESNAVWFEGCLLY